MVSFTETPNLKWMIRRGSLIFGPIWILDLAELDGQPLYLMIKTKSFVVKFPSNKSIETHIDWSHYRWLASITGIITVEHPKCGTHAYI